MCALGLGAAAVALPALADHIDLGAQAPDVLTGIAWDDDAAEVIVTNDGGDIMATAVATGQSRGVTFTGPAESVQALGLFLDTLYIADVGDENASRDFVTVYGVDPSSGTTNYRAWDFSYPDGPRDAKAMAISGKGRIYIITAGDDPAIYRAALDPSRGDINSLVRAADAPEGVTDAAFLDDGSTLMLRTATGVDLVDAYTWEIQASTTYVGAPQGESITLYTPDRMLVGGTPLLRDEPLPDGMTTVTPAPPIATASPSNPNEPAPSEPASTESASEKPQPSPTAEVSRRGTLLALVGAGAVAILAGVVVFMARD